jgi:hypothetical protein
MEPILLSIDEVEGNTTTIVHNPQIVLNGNVTTIVHNTTQQTLREKVFCVLGTLGYVHTPIHTHTFTPRHLSAMTVTMRKYDPASGTFKPLAADTSRVGLWFKIQTEDC